MKSFVISTFVIVTSSFFIDSGDSFITANTRTTSSIRHRASPIKRIIVTVDDGLLLPTRRGQSKSDDYLKRVNFYNRACSSMFTLHASLLLDGGSDGEEPQQDQQEEQEQERGDLNTLLRVGIPSALSGVVAFLSFPYISLYICTLVNDAGAFAVLSQDSSQFVQNFLTVSSLLFSILIGQTYYFMYTQQEAVYYALFREVTEAKSLLEQVALVCQGRGSMYQKILDSISVYVSDDLKNISVDPAVSLSNRPGDDPLESVMYLTSVGVPSTVYETVRSLRQARAARLGALQRKLPEIHILILWILAAIELVSFPLLGAGTQTIGGYKLLTVEGCLFGVMTTGIVMTVRVVGELWRPAGGAYNVDDVLAVMVSGLEEELEARVEGSNVYKADGAVSNDAIFSNNGDIQNDYDPLLISDSRLL